jgi:hypothetical protein
MSPHDQQPAPASLLAATATVLEVSMAIAYADTLTVASSLKLR